ncbi:unnamed protein product (macronuclear) [Paramecium tetraurelia]|uniref:Uncharacterized protein n=1 Tax=Paramecium tetraurelia TaxID=5888 RepID=A0D7G5_PARTE|nr:uncharacterized protein GSPATT00002024001 [Paramecium tetraurelia]CAK78982.1 unnamed protein product [Paramecium tetraurelia]|eukprot:XP_001446379.1 hypothetical protein (macronuclear) [Paramecium tetraurelia strain d4-2]
MKSQDEELFLNFKIRLRYYAKSKTINRIRIKKKMGFTPNKVCNQFNCTQQNPKQTICIPSIITVSLQNQLQYQKPLKTQREPQVSIACFTKSVPKLNNKV